MGIADLLFEAVRSIEDYQRLQNNLSNEEVEFAQAVMENLRIRRDRCTFPNAEMPEPLTFASVDPRIAEVLKQHLAELSVDDDD